MTRSILLGGLACIASCSFLQKQDPVVEPKVQTVSSREEERPAHTATADLPELPGRANTGARKNVTSDSAQPSGLLPGDVRRGLRSPELPSNLPMTIDGKINRGDERTES